MFSKQWGPYGGMQISKGPYSCRFKFILDQCPKTREKVKDGSCVPYASVVGSQMLTMVCTRPNIS